MFTVSVLELTEFERAELQRPVPAHTTTKRARLVLACADGVPLRQVAADVGMDQRLVGLWRRGFETEHSATSNSAARRSDKGRPAPKRSGRPLSNVRFLKRRGHSLLAPSTLLARQVGS
jgi:hypothetical protein